MYRRPYAVRLLQRPAVAPILSHLQALEMRALVETLPRDGVLVPHVPSPVVMALLPMDPLLASCLQVDAVWTDQGRGTNLLLTGLAPRSMYRDSREEMGHLQGVNLQLLGQPERTVLQLVGQILLPANMFRCTCGTRELKPSEARLSSVPGALRVGREHHLNAA